MRWTAWGHEEEGAPLAKALLGRMGIKHSISVEVEPLVANHLITSHLREISARAIRRLAMRLAPANIQKLTWLIEADHSGRPPLPGGLPDGARKIFEMAQQQAVDEQPQAPWILGRHVLPYFDGRPGKHIGEVVRAASEAQADGEFSNEPDALVWLERYISHSRN